MPVVDESQLLRMQFAKEDISTGLQGGRPVAVIVLQDGTELHFFQFVDSDDESLDNNERSVHEQRLRSFFTFSLTNVL